MTALAPGARVAVVGGGVSGLTAARRLRVERPDLLVTVWESSPRLGGKLALAEVAGVTVDVGAESVLNRRPEAVGLIREVGLGDDLVHPATYSASIWTRSAVRPMPPSVMGVPADLDALRQSGILSDEGVDRAAADTERPAPTDDTSVGEVIEARLGAEVVDRLVEPLLGGVYAGHARELSLRATVPQVAALLDQGGSLVEAAAAQSRQRSDVPVFAGIAGGVGRLVAALTQDSAPGPGRLQVETGRPVRELRRTPDGWRLVVGSAADPEQVDVDAVVLATPPSPASRLLTDVAPAAARALARVETASVAVVTLAVPADQMPPTTGSGFLVPPVDQRVVKAATFSFAKWDWVRAAGEARDVALLRASVGRHREEHVLQRSDDEIVAAVRADLADAIGLRARPVDAHVQRWGGSLPQYAVGHLELVASVREAVARVPGLAVCGASYDGVGIAACVALADRAARSLLS